MQPEACLVCAKPLVYSPHARQMECHFCHRAFAGNAACEDGHFICDECHANRCLARARAYCLASGCKNPVEVFLALTMDDSVSMHGPEHHFLVPMALLCAWHNAGGAGDLPALLDEAIERGQQVPGGICGFWGCCGAGVGAGIFASLVQGATPLSTRPWALANGLTARCLTEISRLGGPRCCKRNGFTVLLQAAAFAQAELGIPMELPQQVACPHSARNAQCKKRACPYHAGTN